MIIYYHIKKLLTIQFRVPLKKQYKVPNFGSQISTRLCFQFPGKYTTTSNNRNTKKKLCTFCLKMCLTAKVIK